MKKILSAICAVVLMLTCVFTLPTRAEAATVESGKCGANLTWTWDGEGTLTISGTGAMTDYTDTSSRPWNSIFYAVEKVVIKSGVTTIGDWAFSDGVKMEQISIPGTVTKIGDGALSMWHHVEEFTVPAGVTSIGEYALGNCPKLRMIKVASGNTAFYADSKGVLYNKNKTVLVQAPTLISGTYSIPSTVTTISARAFEDCSNLQSVTGMANVKQIGEKAFRTCRSLQSFSVPSGVKVLPEHLFNDCTGLQSVTIPASVEEIYTSAFEYCSSLKTITVNSQNANYSSSGGVLYNKNKSVLLYASCGLSGTYTVPASVKVIDYAAFGHCYNLENVIIPEGVTEIGHYAFWYCYNLKSLHIPASVQYYGNGVLEGCTSLEAITVAEENAYYSSDDRGVLFSKDKTFLIEGPRAIKGVYIVPDTVAQIQSYAFANSQYLEGVVIPESVWYVGNGAFMDCRDLTLVVLPKSLTFIDGHTFRKNEYMHKKLENVYYAGTKEEWESVEISSENESLQTATIHYNSTGPELAITKQPANAVASNGATAKTKVTATGLGLSYAWYFKDPGKTEFSKSSITTDTYSASMNSWRSGRQVYCVVTDLYGNSVTSDVATLLMGNTAKITAQPKSVYAANGAQAKTTLTATGDGLTYTWYFKNAGSSTWSKSSLTGNSYYVTMKSTTKGRQVYCLVKDKYGNSVKSITVTLNMGNLATITKQPTNAAAASGKKITVKISATGDGLTYTWYYKNKGASSYSKSSITTNTYSVTSKTAVNGRKVYCVVKDKYGNSVKSNEVTLYKGKPAKITTQPKTVTVANGKQAKVTVKASGDGLKYTWYFKNAGSSTWSKSSLTGNSYYVTMKSTTKNRQVYCVVTDKYGISVKSNVVTLKMK